MISVFRRKSYAITTIERKEDGLFLHSERGILRIQPQSDSIVRITYTEREAFVPGVGIGITHEGSGSNWDYVEHHETITITLPNCIMEIAKETGSIRYFDQSHTLLLAERDRESRILDEFDAYKTVVDENTKIERIKTPDGMKQVIKEASTVFDKKLYHTRLSLCFQEDEKLFGLGQAEEGVLNLRGTTQYLHQANLKIAIPFLLSTKGYGLLFATGSPAIFQDTAYGSYFYTQADDQMDFYFICGKNMDTIIGGYRFLTGKAALLPRWAFGFIQSQERYETEEEILQTAEEFQKRKIGVDGIVLDWCSWEDGHWGQKTLDQTRFPTPQEMISKLHEKDIHFMISIWPNMNDCTAHYREFFDQKLLLPASEIYDAYNPAARALYWKQAKEGLFDYGVDAWWCDSSEPFTPEWNKIVKPEPTAMYQEFVREAGKFLPQTLTNAYGLAHARTMYEGQRSVTDKKRVTNLTRNTYTGGQKYGTILWSGDTYAAWETMKKQIVAGLNFCASGFPYWTLDIGAFFIKKGVQWFWNGDYEQGLEDLGYRELYVRWFQYGAFLPIFRCHGTDVRREIWHYGDEGDLFYDALVAANQLRYRLIPYIYSWAAKCWREDGTMMRMLAFDFAHDQKATEVTDQYLFGESLLVCPVVEPMYYDVHSKTIIGKEKGRTVYLPEGSDWYDFYTDKKYAGGQTIFSKAELDKIPLFVKAGSILPMTAPLQNTKEVETAELEFHVYPDQDCAFCLYEDSGDGYGYENGEYTLVNLTWNQQQQKLIAEGKDSIPGKVVLHGE